MRDDGVHWDGAVVVHYPTFELYGTPKSISQFFVNLNLLLGFSSFPNEVTMHTPDRIRDIEPKRGYFSLLLGLPA